MTGSTWWTNVRSSNPRSLYPLAVIQPVKQQKAFLRAQTQQLHQAQTISRSAWSCTPEYSKLWLWQHPWTCSFMVSGYDSFNEVKNMLTPAYTLQTLIYQVLSPVQDKMEIILSGPQTAPRPHEQCRHRDLDLLLWWICWPAIWSVRPTRLSCCCTSNGCKCTG